MPIIVDFNQTIISTLMSQVGSNPNNELSETLIRHMVLTTLLSYKRKFSEPYGNLILAADDRNYWRRDIFPYYKANRKKMRESSGFDWSLIFNTLNKLKMEIKQHFPYKLLQVSGAEADDIIGTLCKYFSKNELIKEGLISHPQEILIVSGDKDFLQLHKYSQVKQYSPIQRKFLYAEFPDLVLKEHIIRGDSGDGVPNILSDDAVFVENRKQSSIFTKKVEDWLTKLPEEFCNEKMLRNFYRNRTLIDLDYIPEDLSNYIVEEFKKPIREKPENLFSYFIEHGLKYLLEDIHKF